MSDTNYNYALHFGESLSSEFDKSFAISSLTGFFNSYHLGPTPHAVCGSTKTESDKPVILASLLPAEAMRATSLGFKAVPIKPEIV